MENGDVGRPPCMEVDGEPGRPPCMEVDGEPGRPPPNPAMGSPGMLTLGRRIPAGCLSEELSVMMLPARLVSRLTWRLTSRLGLTLEPPIMAFAWKAVSAAVRATSSAAEYCDRMLTHMVCSSMQCIMQAFVHMRHACHDTGLQMETTTSDFQAYFARRAGTQDVERIG